MLKLIEWILSAIVIFISNPISIASVVLISTIGLLISKFINIKVFIFYYIICLILALIGFCGRGNLYLIFIFVPSAVALTVISLIFIVIAYKQRTRGHRGRF